ncbi:MAG: SMP-30/gluconolactonase/LRE family protein [Candidatus Wenzhouxiangella sp. M2_3B_020]
MKRIVIGILLLVGTGPIVADASKPADPRAIVESVYTAFAEGNMNTFAGLMSPDIVWNEAEGNPYADRNPYIGPDAVMAGLFARLAADWDDFSATPGEFVVDGDRVVVFGRYKETWKATGKTIDIPFVHSWTVSDGRLIEFQQFTNTAALVETMGERPGPADTEERTQAYEQIAVFPADRSLVRPEDGVMLADGTLLIADQRHGLVALATDGSMRPFGDFASAGYVHEPPERSAGPNGVAMEPDGIHVLVADILTGAIYRINTETEQVVRIHQHEFGANSARRDSSGAVWFTQSTRNRAGPDSEARMFAAVDSRSLDGALFRLPPPADGSDEPVAERKVAGLAFGNGVALDEVGDRLYVAETMADRIVSYRLDVEAGSLTEGRILAELPTPDNIELDSAGNLWVASPIANALLVVDTESGEWASAFHPRTEAHARMMTEWQRRAGTGEPRLELFTPDMWEPLPGLITGLILAPDNETIYLTGLGDSLVELVPSEQ